VRGSAILATLALLAAAPAVAQQAGAKRYQEPDQLIATPEPPAIDWSKPVVGVDANILNQRAKDAPLPVEVYTIEGLKAQKSPAIDDVLGSLKEPEERYDPAKIGVSAQRTAPKDGVPAPTAPARTPQN
jgi:hypothetical protein